MSQDPSDLVYDDAESSGIQLQVASPSSPNGTNDSSRSSIPEHERDLYDSFREFQVLFSWNDLIANTKALASRFIQLVRRPEQAASVILDVYSVPLFALLNARQPGVDFLYPLSSLKKRQSGRLARLILEQSRDLLQRDIREAASSQEGVDPLRVAVIDLDEVPRGTVERGYSVPADITGFMIMLSMLQILITLSLYLFGIDPHSSGKLASAWAAHWFGEWVGWVGYRVGFMQGTIGWSGLPLFCAFAMFRGDGALTLIGGSSPIVVPGSAVFLDRNFTMVLVGNQSVVEAITESRVGISQPISRGFDRFLWQMCQIIFYWALQASCMGILLASFLECWLFLHPSSRSIPLVAILIVSMLPFRHTIQEFARRLVRPRSIISVPFAIHLLNGYLTCLWWFIPSSFLMQAYELSMGLVDESFRNINLRFRPILNGIPFIVFIIIYASSRDFPLRTGKLLDILGDPPIRRWEFDTLAAAATFQCLVLCRNIPRPIKTIDVLTLIDVIVLDQTELWRVWKKRVADRITHEVEISFAPTLPSFGDQRQKRLKELLDQAQLGYDVYKDFYHRHVPLYSTEVSTITP